jgi:hypothetical protein
MRGTWEGSGTWQTSSGVRLRHVAGIVVALLLLGSGTAIATAVLVMLIAAGAVVLLCVAGLAVWLVRRACRGYAAPQPCIVQPYAVHQLGAPERPALEQPRELHLHLHGLGPEQVAAILRKAK